VLRNGVVAAATTRPTVTPTTAMRSPSRSSRRITLADVAPSATRRPISGIRRATE
jgi:hypothetical protein